MPDLWEDNRDTRRRSVEPLAVRMRPRTLEEFVGQGQFLAQGKLLRRMLEAGRLTSLLFWGPPGTGKTTLAEVIANDTAAHYERANAASIGVKRIREIIDEADFRLQTSQKRTILFLDEIHRFSKSQQDVLLTDVERGVITLIGATTENPYFAVNSALVSRATVLRFEPLSEKDIANLLRQAIGDQQRGMGRYPIEIADEAIEHWSRVSDGDARRALTALEIAVLSQKPQSTDEADSDDRREEESDQARDHKFTPIHIDLQTAAESIQHKAVVYDGSGDEHYDIISAFIKSMRGSDPDAAVYWLARMLEAGEDPRFIARRIAILASEDIGNADPQAIAVAASAWEIAERIGLPEAQLTLSQATIYMATAPKSNACTRAIGAARADVREGRTIPVPRHLRDSHYAGAKKLGHGENYIYPHNSADRYVDQEYLGVDRVFYEPTSRGYEAEISRRLNQQREPPDESIDQTPP